ncbi:MAG: HemK2/MTQ2 family protein methyltransferase [Halobacteriaceae archaeon]
MTDLAERRGATGRVYQPAEDSRLLADAVVAGVDAGECVLEVGTGSGYVAARVAAAGADVVASDLNPHACRQARERGVSVVRADLLDPFAADAFDAVAFNPPYLPDEVPPDADRSATGARDDWMEVALSGGESGREVVDAFLDDVGRVLRESGVVYLLVSSLTGVEAVVERAAEEGFSAAVVAEESFPFETLTVLRFRR